jgi:hypothetical protein
MSSDASLFLLMPFDGRVVCHSLHLKQTASPLQTYLELQTMQGEESRRECRNAVVKKHCRKTLGDRESCERNG